MEKEFRGTRAHLARPAQYVAKTQKEMRDLWLLVHGKPGCFTPSCPTLDDNSMMIAVFMGTKNSGGYAITITDVKNENGKLVVEYSEKTPPRGAMTTCVMTSPFFMKIVEKSDAEIEFRKVTPPAPRNNPHAPPRPGFRRR